MKRFPMVCALTDSMFEFSCLYRFLCSVCFVGYLFVVAQPRLTIVLEGTAIDDPAVAAAPAEPEVADEASSKKSKRRKEKKEKAEEQAAATAAAAAEDAMEEDTKPETGSKRKRGAKVKGEKDAEYGVARGIDFKGVDMGMQGESTF